MEERKSNIIPASIVIAGAVIAGALLYDAPRVKSPTQEVASERVVLPASWNNLDERLKEEGVIDEGKWKQVYAEERAVTDKDGQLFVSRDNAGFLLNMLWALGLGNKNALLEEGEMVNPKYGRAGNFASTAGWTLAVGNPMSHYSAHELISLSPEQQELVEKVAGGIYRPCCSNSAAFPDCNHGLAMLALLELMASQGVSEEDMYRYGHLVNSYWFPEFYEKNNDISSGCSVS